MKLQMNLKFTAKQMDKAAKKCEKEEVVQKNNVKKAMQKGNMDGARIYAANAIRKKNEALNYMRLSSRMDAVHGRVQTAVKMQQVTRSMAQVTKGMEGVLASMDPAKIGGVMDQFEKQFEDMDVMAGYVDTAIAGTTAMTTPEDQVTDLLAAVADENTMQLSGELHDITLAKRQNLPAEQDAAADDLSARLAALKTA